MAATMHAWSIVKDLCSKKHIEWPQGFDISSIMALPLLKIKSPSATCLLLIAASECASLLENWPTSNRVQWASMLPLYPYTAYTPALPVLSSLGHHFVFTQFRTSVS